MPPAIPDSDDDSDNVECEDTVASSRASRPKPADGPENEEDGSSDRSTGSTELLRRQIQSAERGLLSNSAPGGNQNSSASPARQAAKRRHTAAFDSESNTSPEKSVKRTKSLKTYGAGRRQTSKGPADDGHFDVFREDRILEAGTSQSPRFSEHSGQQSSINLPAQEDFKDHEPNEMFKESGDTVEDASSEQQRQFDQAVPSKKGLSTSVSREAHRGLEQQNSSIPWTESDLANSARSRKSHQATQGAYDTGYVAGETAERDESHENGSRVIEQPGPSQQNVDKLNAARMHEEVKTNEFSLRKPRSSPVVEIPRQPSRKSSTGGGASKSLRRSSKGSGREVQDETSEPLNSDDKAIGLPKEIYKPRHSRSRTTPLDEEPIDYSIVPEKAAKVKRLKTAGAETSVAVDQQSPVVSHAKSGKDGATDDTQTKGQTSEKDSTSHDGKQQSNSPVKPRRTIKQQDAHCQTGSVGDIQQGCASQQKSEEAVDDKADEDEIFVKPPVPTPKPKSSSKVKRAQTTIFEDHVEFLGSRRSPNLSQQQAQRASALKDLRNEEAPSKSQRKRKSIVAEDSEEDELAKQDEEIDSKVQSPPKKRRARPSRKDQQAKAKEPALQDSDAGDEEERPEQAKQLDEEEQPKRRGRGRPAKSSEKTSADTAELGSRSDGEKAAEKSTGADGKVEQPETERPASQTATTPSKPSAPAAEIPTPSPDKRSEKAKKATPQPATGSPAQHSPIKNSSKVPLRVGLSKRHRIPPLLRVNRPPKP